MLNFTISMQILFTRLLTFVMASDGNAFLTQLNSAINDAMGVLMGLAPAVAGIAWVIAKLWQMIIPEQQGRAEPREWARNAIVTYVAIVLGAKLIAWIGVIFGG